MKEDVAAKLGIDYPIIQGPFGGGLSTPRLVAGVSNAGGLGSFGAHYLPPEGIAEISTEIRALTEKPFALNLWVSDQDDAFPRLTKAAFEARCRDYNDLFEKLQIQPPGWPADPGPRFETQVEAVLRARPRVFSFVFGIPSRSILDECRKQQIITLGAATTIEEALSIEAAGVDMVVVSGFEAGGHRPSFIARPEDSLNGTLALVPAVRDAVRIPVVAAGGLGDRRGVRAALTLGADAVQLGTAFLACEESGAHPIHREAILNNRLGHTTLSRAYTGRLARFIPNAFTRRFEDTEQGALPFPAQHWLAGPIKAAAAEQGNSDYLSMYSGQAAPILKHSSVTSLMEHLIQEFQRPV